MTAKPEVKGFFDKRTFSVQYVVTRPGNRQMRHHRPGARL